MSQSNENKLVRGFGLWSSLSLVVGTVIGSGIFFKQGSVLQSAGSTDLGLLAWLLGGLLTLCSALTIAELGSQMTKTGGIYNYLENLYGEFVGFLAGWMQVVLYGPAMMGAVSAYFALLFSEFMNIDSKWNLLISFCILIFIGLLNSVPNRFTAGFQIITTSVKMLPVIALIVYGLLFGNKDAFGQVVNQVATSGQGGWASFGVAVLATLFAYDGWVTLANITGEIKNPQKTLPKAIVGGVLIVLFSYVGVSYGIYQSLSATEIASLGENATLTVAKQAFGEMGGRLVSLAILISLLGTLNGKVVSFPRVLFAMADRKQFIFPNTFSHISMRSRTPNEAIWFMLGIALIMIIGLDPDRLSDIAIFITFLFYIMTFIGVFILRKKDPKGINRPFSMPLYPIIPLIAILGSLYVEISEVVMDFEGVISSIILVAAGSPVYLYLKKKYNK